MLDEGLAIVTGLRREDNSSLGGGHYQVRDVTLRSTQAPAIPIWVGGGWPRPGVLRRASRLEGFVPIKLTAEDVFVELGPADVRAIRADFEAVPNSTPPEIIVGGKTPGDRPVAARTKLREYADAGTAWWIEFCGPYGGPADEVRRRVRQGPAWPRLARNRAAAAGHQAPLGGGPTSFAVMVRCPAGAARTCGRKDGAHRARLQRITIAIPLAIDGAATALAGSYMSSKCSNQLS